MKLLVLRRDFQIKVNLDIRNDINLFNDLPPEIARRFIFALVQNTAAGKDLFRGDGWQLFSLKTKFKYAHYAVNIDIREAEQHYSIYLNPTFLTLLPVTEFPRDHLFKNRALMKIIKPDDKDRIRQWGHSTYPTRVGLFVEFESEDENSNSLSLKSDDSVYVKRTLKTQDLIKYPAFALRMIATKNEIDNLELTKQNRRAIQPLSQNRLKETKQWATRLFPENTLDINDRRIQIENKIGLEESASRYNRNKSLGKNIWYPNTALLFDPSGTKTDYSQLKGLRTHHPFDQDSDSRDFDKVQPFLIVPGDFELLQLSNQLFEFLESGYIKRKETTFGDDDFEGFDEIFKAPLIPPSDKDIIQISECNLQEYTTAVQSTLVQWAGSENKNPNRIAIVVIPDQYGDLASDDSYEDPYIPLKKLFIEEGLPSQMIEMGHLRCLQDSSFAYGHLLWNLALNLYVKLGGKPWALAQQINDVHSLVGLGFGRATSQEKSPIHVGVANVFDKNGQWVSFTSEDKALTEEEELSFENKEYFVAGTSSFKLRQELTYEIINNSLNLYTVSSKNRVATKVILHKNGMVYEPEALGFLQALSASVLDGSEQLADAKFGLVSILKNHELRMYGPDHSDMSWRMQNTITRGSTHILSENSALIATTGKNAFYYPGIGTPKPVLIERFIPSTETLEATGFNLRQMYSIEEICEQILALTQIHWGSTRNIRLPITSEYAQRIARFVARSQVRADMLLKLKKLWWL